jgi:hypothetical protein
LNLGGVIAAARTRECKRLAWDKTICTHGSLPILSVSALSLHILSPLYANKNENLNCAAADKEQQAPQCDKKPHLVIVRWASSSPQFLHLLQFLSFFFGRRGKTNEQFSIPVSARTQSDYFASIE